MNFIIGETMDYLDINKGIIVFIFVWVIMLTITVFLSEYLIQKNRPR